MAYTTSSGTLIGFQFVPVEVEVFVGSSKNNKISIVGLPDTCVKEAKERVISALASVGFKLSSEILINLSPADIKKEGTEVDLGICVAVLKSVGRLEQDRRLKFLYLGEVGLDGAVKKSFKTLHTVVGAYVTGVRDFVLPASIKPDLERLPLGLNAVFINSLADLFQDKLCEKIQGGAERNDIQYSIEDLANLSTRTLKAILLSVVGYHSLFLIGPPGQGKTYTANLISRFLPRLTENQILENYLYHSLAGEPVDSLLTGESPFRSPHHSVTKAALLGGGLKGRPGEVTLANHGVLFLDELGEFSRSTLNSLRVPIETGVVALSRANYNYTLPAKFLLVCASNPCPCGYFGSRAKPCRCSMLEVKKYLAKFHGPFLERVDLQLFLDDSFLGVIRQPERCVSNVDRERDYYLSLFENVEKLRHSQLERFGSLIGCLDSKSVVRLAKDRGWFEMLKHYELSVRSLLKVIKIAMTHALLHDRLWPEQVDFQQAILFRKLDKLIEL